MKRYTLFLDTGSCRGALYNFRGDNLTDGLPGAGTTMVGGWSRDFASVLQTGKVDTNGDIAAGTLPQFTNELSTIVADGRLLANASLSYEPDPYEADFDIDEEEADDHSIVTQGEKYIGVKRLHIRLSAARPKFAHAGYWVQDGADGTLQWSDIFKDWLDGGYEPTDEMATADIDAWARNWQHLRVPLHWALYKVRVQPTAAPKLAEMLANNSNTPQGHQGFLSFGPYGMLKAMYGTSYAAEAHVRLWDLADGMRIVDKGELEVPFDLADIPNDAADPTDQVDADIIDMDWTADPSGAEATVVTRGANVHVVFRSGRFIELQPDEVLIFHLQTGRVRVEFFDDPGGPDTFHGIMGPPNEGTNTNAVRAGGPFLDWYRWTAGAWYYDARPRRRSRTRGR